MSTQTSSLYGEPTAHEAGLHRSLPLEWGISLVRSETSRGHRQEFTSKTYSEANNRGKGYRGVNIHLLGHTGLLCQVLAAGGSWQSRKGLKEMLNKFCSGVS